MTRSGRLISPTSIRDLTPLEHLKTTIGTWYQTTSASPPTYLSSLSPPSKTTSLPPVSSSTLKGELLENNNEIESKWGNYQGSGNDTFSELEGLDEVVTVNGLNNKLDKIGNEKVLWSKWDELIVDVTGVINRRILILGYQEGLALWDCSSLDSWFELLNLPTLNTSLSKELSCRFPLGIGNVVTACILPTPTLSISSTGKDFFENSRPLLAIITSSSTTTSSNLLLYSLSNHSIIHSQSLPISATPHQLKVNKNFLVISTTSSKSISTASLHFYDSKTLKESNFSPLIDLATSSTGEVIFDLGKGGRILAYNSTRSLPSSYSTSFHSSPSALNGILSLKGMFDPPHLHYSSYSTSSTTSNLTSEASHLLGEATLITSDAARRMGEGVLNGVKKISVLGRDWLNGLNITSTLSGGVGEVEEEDVEGETKLGLAKSLPLPKNGFGERRRASVGSPSFNSLSSSTSIIPRKNESSSNSTIVILDLLSLVPSSSKSSTYPQSRNPSSPIPMTPKLLAHFKPYNIPLESLSLSPSSSSIFTSSSQGYSFDIFELKPQVQIGRSSTISSSSSSKGIEFESLWHRYRLIRGFTTALVEKVTWSEDEKFLAVGTKGRGTTHIYAINRTGGKPDLETHFASKVVNSQELSPLSVTLSSISRIRSSPVIPTSPSDTLDPPSSSSIVFPPSITFLPKQTSLSTSLPSLSLPPPPTSPTKRSTNLPWTSITPSQSQHNYPPPESQFQDILIYQPHLNKSILNRLTTVLRPTTTVGQVTQGDMGRLARGVGASLLKGSGVVVDGNKKEVEEEKWEVCCKGKIEWNLNEGDEGGEVREIIDFGEKKGSERKRVDGRFSAQVEIETFSRSTHVLPKSIYQSQQFDFYSLPSNHLSITSTGSSVLPLRKIEVRSEVLIRPGAGANDSNPINDSSSNPKNSKEFEPASFEVPIMCAIQTKLDQDEARSGGKEGIYNPTFPNGIAGRQRHWRETLPITVVGVNVNEGLGRMRRELGRVAIGASNMSRRRRTSLSTNMNSTSTNYSSSISFEEDDAVWTERVNEENSESGSTGCTSEREDGEEGEEEDLMGDDICWNLEGVNGSGLELNSTIEEVPFEDDDDFFGEKQVLISPPTITSVDQDNSSSSFEPSSLEQDHLLVGRPNNRKRNVIRKKPLTSSASPKAPLCDLD